MTYLIFLLVFVVSIFLITKYKVKGVIFLVIFMLPFRFELFSIGGIGIRITDLLSVSFITVWLIKILAGKIRKYDFQLLNFVIIFFIIVLSSFLINALRFSSVANIVDLIRITLALMTGIAISTSLKEKSDFIILFKTWVVSATLSSSISIFFFFSNGYGINTLFNLNNLSVVEFYSIKFSNSVFFEDPNNLASYLLISIFITIGVNVKDYIPFKYKYLFLAVQILGLVLTLSRSAYMAALLALLLFLFAYKIKVFRWWLLKIIVISVIVINSIPFIVSLNSDTSAMSRIELWQVGINMTLSNPILGVGIGNSSMLFNDYLSSTLLLYNPHFHNMYLTISSEFGLIGLISFISIFFKHLYKWSHSNDMLYKFLCLGLISYLIQGFGVEYFASRHFWVFLPLLILYSSTNTSEISTRST